MSMEQEAIDAIEDAAESMSGVAKAISKLKPSVVVNVPKSDAPTVHVSAPSVSVNVPQQKIPAPNITVLNPATEWTFQITERDHNGRIKTFTATPTP